MKSTYLRITLSVIGSLLLGAGAIFWAASLMGSLYAYRSPLKENPPEPGASLGEPITRRIVIVLVDALREDTSRNAEVMPYLNQLRDQGAWAIMHSQPPSYSEPGYAVLLTGAWPDVNDSPAINLPYQDIPVFTQDNIFSAAHRSGLNTAISGYYWFEKLIPQATVDTSFYTQGEDQLADRAVVDAALPWLRNGDYQLVLIHLDQVDYAGHYEGGPRDPHWDQAANRIDEILRETVTTLNLTQDTLLVVSDHGQIDPGGHGGHEKVTLLEPFILVGAGIKPGFYGDIYMVDVAPIVAALLGMNLPATGQGAVQVDMLSYPAGNYKLLVDKTREQQAGLLAAYQNAINAKSAPQPVSPGNSSSSPDSIVDAYQNELRRLRETRLNSERVPRILLVLILTLLPIVMMIWKRGRLVCLYLGGALLYLCLFHLRYAFIDGHTYSLSSVTSAEDLISYVFQTSTLALGVCWLCFVTATRLFRQHPTRAFEITIDFLLVVIFITSLPILLSYAINGFIVTWTLPHFPSLFLAFLSILQVTVIAGVGLLLACLSAAITWVTNRI